jgi:hypothetical protein
MGKLLTWAVGGKAAGPAKASNGAHRPSRCRDRDCLRPLCTAYKDGREDGHEDGYDDAWEEAQAAISAAYDAGYAAGYAAGAKAN